MRTDKVISEMAHTWVDAGGDEYGLSCCLNQLRQSVREEFGRRSAAEHDRVELNNQVERWEADLHARAMACW